MFVRLLHGAVALSLASEPAAASDASDAPETSASTADESTEPESDAPAADAPAADVPAADAPATDAPAADAPAPDAPAIATDTDAPPADTDGPTSPADEATEDADATAPAEAATAPPSATEAPRPILGPAPSGRNSDIVRRALIGGGIASLTLTAGLIGASAWAWTERSQANRAAPDLTGQARLDAEDRQDQMRTIGVVTTAAAALYGTTGVVLLLLNARDRKQPPRTVLAPNPGGLSLVGRF